MIPDEVRPNGALVSFVLWNVIDLREVNCCSLEFYHFSKFVNLLLPRHLVARRFSSSGCCLHRIVIFPAEPRSHFLLSLLLTLPNHYATWCTRSERRTRQIGQLWRRVSGEGATILTATTRTEAIRLKYKYVNTNVGVGVVLVSLVFPVNDALDPPRSPKPATAFCEEETVGALAEELISLLLKVDLGCICNCIAFCSASLPVGPAAGNPAIIRSLASSWRKSDPPPPDRSNLDVFRGVEDGEAVTEDGGIRGDVNAGEDVGWASEGGGRRMGRVGRAVGRGAGGGTAGCGAE